MCSSQMIRKEHGINYIKKSHSHYYSNELSSDFRFKAIYFLDNVTGTLLLCKKYKLLNDDESKDDLIGGFLSALNMFIKEINIDDDEEEIREINFKKTRILYDRKGRLSLIAITNKTNLILERKILHNLLLNFYNKYESYISNFNGRMNPSFQNFKKILDLKHVHGALSRKLK